MRVRLCCNKCLFCFVDQLPGNARETMRVKDDDWRMSLMMGNYVTLTNVSDRELDRIIERHAPRCTSPCTPPTRTCAPASSVRPGPGV